jgi:hypothetical protein
MKSGYSALMVLGVFLFSICFIAAAQTGDETVPQETREQAKLMVTSHGAKVRMMQLQYSLEEQVRTAEKVIERAKEMNASFDSTELEIILEELKEVRGQAATADYGKPTEEVVQDFVDLKHDAVQLSQQFRSTVQSRLTEQERNQLRDGLKDGLDAELAQVRERLKAAVREHNSERIRSAIQAMKSSDSGNLAQAAMNGDLDRDQLMERVRDKVKEMTSSQKAEAAQAMKSAAEQNMQRAQSAVQAAGEGFQERLTQRVQERLESVRQSMGLSLEDIDKRLGQVLPDSVIVPSGQGASPGGGEGL